MPPQRLLGDCLQLFKNIGDETIDLVLTDCPYRIIAGGVTIKEGLDETSGILRKRAVSDGTDCSNKWLKKGEDSIPSAVKAGKMFAHNDIKFSEWLPEAFRVLKKGTHCYKMINSRNLKDLQVEAEKVGFVFQNLLVWHKTNSQTPNKYYMQNAEFILMLSKRPAKNINDMGSKTVISIPNIIGNKSHPSEKPISLMEILIRNSTQEGETVLDPFMGGGSTGLASINLNRSFIGFEIDEEYFKVATEMVNQNNSPIF